MSFIEQSMSKGEKLVERIHLHWFAKLPYIIWGMMAIVSLLIFFMPAFNLPINIPPDIWYITAAVVVGFCLIMALWHWLKFRSIEQGVTNKRVILKTGFVTRKTEEMKLQSIETVEIDQTLSGRLFNFGNVKVTGKGQSDVFFKNVGNPMEVKRTIEGVEYYREER